jgi:hypothetical protein
LESQIGDFLGGGVNLLVVVSVEFMVKNPLGLFDLFDIFSDARADEPILEPSIGSFHFTFGLRRKGIGDLHIAILKDLLPLGGGFVGEEVVFIPEGVSAPDKSEDRVTIDVIAIGESVLEDDGLKGQDMGPAGFRLEQSGVEHESAVIIQRSDEIPFFLRGGCPEVVGGIMLNEFPGITG